MCVFVCFFSWLFKVLCASQLNISMYSYVGMFKARDNDKIFFYRWIVTVFESSLGVSLYIHWIVLKRSNPCNHNDASPRRKTHKSKTNLEITVIFQGPFTPKMFGLDFSAFQFDPKQNYWCETWSLDYGPDQTAELWFN